MFSDFFRGKSGFAAALLTLCLCIGFQGCFAASETQPEQQGSSSTVNTGTEGSSSAAQGGSESVSGTDTGTGTQNETPETETAVKRRKNGKYNKWEKKNGYRFYYNDRGRKARGLTKIKGKKYLFDKRGRQQHGWQKVNNAYYYFYLTPGKKGYMASNTTINGISLKKNGKALATAWRSPSTASRWESMRWLILNKWSYDTSRTITESHSPYRQCPAAHGSGAE